MTTHAPSSTDNPARVRRVLWTTLALNLFVCVLKGTLGALTGSVALLADTVHGVFDSTSNVIGLTATHIASQPPDEEHPYGHQKVEVVATFVIGIMIALGVLELGRHAVTGLLEGTSPEIPAWAFLAVLVGLLINIGVSAYERHMGRILGSEILTADADHTASDAWATGAVMAGMGMVYFGFPWADLVAALVVMVLVGFTAYRILRRALLVLIDTSQLDAAEIVDEAAKIEGVRSCHNVRSRGMVGHVHLDLHVTFDPEMSMGAVGERLLDLKGRLRHRFPEVRDIVVQVEPHLPAFLND